MNRVLSVCPTCAWPVLEEVGQCVRCRPLATPENDDNAVDAFGYEIARSVTGQMPSMAVFSETQQASSAEKRSEQAWRRAQEAAAAKRHRRPKSSRWPQVLASVAIVVGMICVALLLPDKGTSEATLATPASDLPWRLVSIDQSSTVELPGPAVASTAVSDFGSGARVATNVPGASIAVTAYRADYGMRGAGAVAIDVLKARAIDLGDANPTSRIKPTRARWGDAYDLTVVTDQPIALLRAVVVGPALFVIETVGPQSTRTTQIFSRVINSLTPKSAA